MGTEYRAVPYSVLVPRQSLTRAWTYLDTTASPSGDAQPDAYIFDRAREGSTAARVAHIELRVVAHGKAGKAIRREE